MTFSPPSRRPSRPVQVGAVTIGGTAPIVVQSMCSTDTRDVAATSAQIAALAEAGCELVRLAVPDRAAAAALPEILRQSPLPVVADIHFNYRLALAALEAGVHGLRLNPGNIRSADKVRQVARAAQERGVPIRVGVNAGSLPPIETPPDQPPPTVQELRAGLPDRLVEAALGHIRILQDLDFEDIVVSLKAFDVPLTVTANRLLARQVPYPLHLGITEAGLPWAGTIRSAVGLGLLLFEGLGDTIRVSLTGDPVEEVRVAYEVLRALNLRQCGPTLISCPTCGRTEVDLPALARQVEERLQGMQAPITVAVMGCVVNGPGEAREADFGIAAGRGQGAVFRHGQIVRTVPEDELLQALMEEIERG
ncbi:MAG: flavodoxin-dependent (E)-4-hydroxy-3-methylbut-2-enyl-diphosphate synthase [Chloroflexia bacterium]|nr:flavodoxin-dependent (E)-4-hydroxy-3-methylbut-2-enyl-diphosphate synthase [Chloroflexia bacterium]